jgi:hypothetical protein
MLEGIDQPWPAQLLQLLGEWTRATSIDCRYRRRALRGLSQDESGRAGRQYQHQRAFGTRYGANAGLGW